MMNNRPRASKGCASDNYVYRPAAALHQIADRLQEIEEKTAAMVALLDSAATLSRQIEQLTAPSSIPGALFEHSRIFSGRCAATLYDARELEEFVQVFTR